MRAGAAPVDVRLRGAVRHHRGPGRSSTSTTCTSTSSTPVVIRDGRYVAPRRTGLLRADARGVHRRVPLPGRHVLGCRPRRDTERSDGMTRPDRAACAGHRRRLRHRAGHRPRAGRARRDGGRARPRPAGVPRPLLGFTADVTDDASVRAAVGAAADAARRARHPGQQRGHRRAAAPSRTTTTSSGTGCSTSTCSAWSGPPGPPCRTCGRSAHAAIVNTCSIAATAGLPQRALYSASKGAVLSLTLAMAADHVREGIRVNCVNPGTADTPVGRPAAGRRRRPGRRARRAQRPAAHGPAGQRRRGRRRHRLPGRSGGRLASPAPRSPWTAACRGCGCGR